ncbi:hypothetical protein U1Q18_010136, partial [Sarracenia purpurea var. burkii]
MESQASERRPKRREDGSSNPRLSNKRKKIYTSFGPPPQTRDNPTPPTPKTEVVKFFSTQSRHIYSTSFMNKSIIP